MYTLLIVEDEQLERQALRFIIGEQCPSINIIGEACDGKRAIELAGREKPDIILMDICMPEINGLDAAKIIKSRQPDTSIVMLTAFDEFKYAKQALNIGALDYLLKPIRPAELLRTLEKIVACVEGIRTKQQEEASLRENVKTAMPFIQMSFVFDLISGRITDLEHFKERAVFLNLKTQPGVALIVDIDNFKQLTCHEPEMKKQILKQRVYQTICDVLGDLALVTPFGSDNLVVLLGVDKILSAEETKKSVLETAQEIKETIAAKLNISVTVGIGRYYEDPREIYRSYNEAVSAQRQCFYLGGNQVIHIENVPYLNENLAHYPFHYERAVVDRVRCGERKQAKAALEKLLNEIFQSKASIETVKACVLELLIVLSRSAVEGGANLDQLTLLNFDCINKLSDCSNKDKVAEWMNECIDNFMDNMLENRSSVNLRVVNKACEYIVANCQHNLSLEEVAQTVHLSPFYFSRLFKKEKGYNFADFITRVRLNKAKKMLQNPDYTVVRIAAEVGYQDASYFCRVFRRECGMTPNQFRSGMNSRSQSKIVQR